MLTHNRDFSDAPSASQVDCPAVLAMSISDMMCLLSIHLYATILHVFRQRDERLLTMVSRAHRQQAVKVRCTQTAVRFALITAKSCPLDADALLCPRLVSCLS